MDKILSKEEVDALLAAVFEGRIDPERELAKVDGGAVSYDLFSAESNKGYIPNLDLIYDGFIRYHRVALSNRLRRMVEIKKIGARTYKFDDFLQTLPSPVCMTLYKIDPFKGAALIAMDSALVFTVVDSILGGTGSPSIPGNRMFTSIELRLMEKLSRDILLDMEKAWAPIHQVRMNLLRMEMNPRLVNIVPPEYQVVTMALKIQIDDMVGDMVFAIPFMTIDPVRDKLRSGVQFDMMAIDPQWSYRLSEDLLEAPLEVSVEMGGATITMDELLALVPGDTITLDTQSRSELVVRVAGVEKFKGIPGVRSGNKAVQVTRVQG